MMCRWSTSGEDWGTCWGPVSRGRCDPTPLSSTLQWSLRRRQSNYQIVQTHCLHGKTRFIFLSLSWEKFEYDILGYQLIRPNISYRCESFIRNISHWILTKSSTNFRRIFKVIHDLGETKGDGMLVNMVRRQMIQLTGRNEMEIKSRLPQLNIKGSIRRRQDGRAFK